MARTTKTAEAAAKTPTPDASTSTCACGCGETVERTFKQGHDQRLISLLAQDLVYASVWNGTCAKILKVADRKNDIQDNLDKVSAYISTKLSPGLAAKFESAAHRQWKLQAGKTERADAKAARKAAKPAAKRKTSGQRAADAAVSAVVPSGAAGVASEVKNSRVGQVVTATASNDDVDAAEAAQDEVTSFKPGDAIRVKIGKRARNANVHGMNQAGKVTAVSIRTGDTDVIKTEGQFEVLAG